MPADDRIHEREEREAPPAPAPAAESGYAATPLSKAVLALQETAGNARTTELIAGGGIGALTSTAGLARPVVARDVAEPADAREAKHEYTLNVPGIGQFPVLSFQLGPDKKSVVVTLDGSPATQELMRAAHSGRQFPSVTLSGRVTVTVNEAIIGSFSVGSGGGENPTVQVEFTGTSIKTG